MKLMSYSDIASRFDAGFDDDLEVDFGEEPPSAETVMRAKALLRDVFENLATWHVATVGTFYGELDVTWEVAKRIVRVIWFPDGRCGLFTGSMTTDSKGEMKYGPTGQDIALELERLTKEAA